MKKSDRYIATAILTEILDSGAYANIALRKVLAGAAHLSPQARAFITEMVNETLRNLYLIDHIIGSFSKMPPDKMKPFILNVLRISVCQIRFLERIPESAAVNEAVLLTKLQGFERLAGFVNGILRSIAREPEKPAVSPKDLALRFSYPPWLVNMLVKQLGAKGAMEFCENSHKPAQITVLANTLKTDTAGLIAALEAEGVVVLGQGFPVQESCGVKDILALRHTGDISKLKAFNDGLFIVIDPGAMTAVNALFGGKNSDAAPRTIIDLCAAPGGKSFATAFAINDMGKILAYDIHPHRVNLIRQTQARLGLTGITPAVKDALVFDPSLANTADAVLLDAPCSGLGTIRRHPEIKYTRTSEDIRTLSHKQSAMLSNAAKYVKPGGTLVYCTCTVANEENSDVVNRFMEAHKGFSLEGTTQTLPNSSSDGFFTARLIKE